MSTNQLSNYFRVVKMFKCDSCGATFTRSDNLSRHQKSRCSVIKAYMVGSGGKQKRHGDVFSDYEDSGESSDSDIIASSSESEHSEDEDSGGDPLDVFVKRVYENNMDKYDLLKSTYMEEGMSNNEASEEATNSLKDTLRSTIQSKMADLEFLKTKWNFLYGLMDINKDGVLSRLDTDEVKTSFVAHHQLEGDAATKACGKIDQFWDKIVFREKQNESNPTVCCNDFVSSLVNSYVDNGQQLKDTMHQLTDISIEIADANGDGFVSFDELFGVYKCYGVNSSPTIKSLFELIGPNSEGLLPLDAVRSFWIEFLIGSDKKKFEEMKKAFGK